MKNWKISRRVLVIRSQCHSVHYYHDWSQPPASIYLESWLSLWGGESQIFSWFCNHQPIQVPESMYIVHDKIYAQYYICDDLFFRFFWYTRLIDWEEITKLTLIALFISRTMRFTSKQVKSEAKFQFAKLFAARI